MGPNPIYTLFRNQPGNEDELKVIGSITPVVHLRSKVPAGSTVIARYSALPNYRELEADLDCLGSKLINSSQQHEYIASLAYAEDLKDLTFKTWHEFKDIPFEYRNQAFVVKGKTNSKKFEWNTKMFAKDFTAAVRIGSELLTDSMIGEQGILIRQFVPLEIFETGVTGMPMANEWRLFFYKNNLLADGFYWSILEDMSPVEAARAEFEKTGRPFAQQCANIIARSANFFAIDIARKANGEWICVEVNDGQMSGLNDSVDPLVLFTALVREMKNSPVANASETQRPAAIFGKKKW